MCAHPASSAQNGELVAQERAAVIAWRIASGEKLTTRQIADATGTTWEGAFTMMRKLSRVLPIGQSDGYWTANPEIAWPY